MHTSTYTDVMDEFLETVTQVDGKYLYQYGEELRPVQTSEVVLKYKEGDAMKEKTFPMYRTHHGPITHRVNGQWTSSAMMWIRLRHWSNLLFELNKMVIRVFEP